MAVYINLPTLYVDFLWPQRMSFNTPGGGLEGGRNGLGESITIGLSGGPHVVGAYDFFCQEPEQHEYLNMVAARLNGSHRFMNVPIWTDWMGPFPAEGPIISGITHSDGSLFSDGAGYSQATVYGEITEAAALNAGVIKMQVFGAARPLRHSDWFSINHSVKGWRATRYWEVRDIDDPEAASPIYTLAIEVPLRQAVAVGQRVEIARPCCVMKFPAGFTLPYEIDPGMIDRVKMEFAEAF